LSRTFFATTPRGLESVLVAELEALGADRVAAGRGGASFEGPLDVAYRACLWCRVANRILLPLGTFDAPNSDALYDGVQSIDWSDHMRPTGSLAVDVVSVGSDISNTHYAAQRTKDAVVDQFREREGERPSVDLKRPDLRIYLFIESNQAIVGIDLAGESLHRRGYRGRWLFAPLKENLAAGLLGLAEWGRLAALGRPFLDPMCGSGTLPIEAALIAADVAPGLFRDYFGFVGWRGHQPDIWHVERQKAEARDQRQAAQLGEVALPGIVGFDADRKAVGVARKNVDRAGLGGLVRIERREPNGWWTPAPEGLIVVNPPYGQRLGEVEELGPLYEELGHGLKRVFGGWTAFVLSGEKALTPSIGLKAGRKHRLFNGPIECRFLEYPLTARGSKPPRPKKSHTPGPGADMFANRLRKRRKHLERWAKRNHITCYRVYDADLPEFNFAVDRYEDCAHVQEYAPPASIDEAKAAQRRRDVMAIVPEVLGVRPSSVFLKSRKRQRGSEQYQRLGEGGLEIEVGEGGHRFLVNLSDHLDTGLFLDHRMTRRIIAKMSPGRRVLNLFGYTGTVTVYAAMAGASRTMTVDMSKTYMDWALRNLRLNGIQGPEHRLERADVLQWIKAHAAKYDLIFLDPPTFSNSKGMLGTFDLQRDHAWLILAAANRLATDGTLLFSNNFRRFKMDRDALASLEIEEITASTIPEDFKRSPRIHNVWLIRWPSNG
jgi:23S rRNA (guanine2445-N2)-methyltransferase / 23S rRNA (guanine2069-N7)-methyltransferase